MGATGNAVPAASPIAVRRACLEDAARIAVLNGQLGYPSTAQDLEQRLRAVLDDPEHAIFIATRADGEVVGWTHVLLLRTIEMGLRTEVGGLVVDENSRSLGVGQQLIEQAESWAREKSCRTIGLRSNVVRTRAHAFYERLGYKVIKMQKSFRKEL